MIIMQMIRGDEGGEKERSLRETEQHGDGEILVEVRPVDPERRGRSALSDFETRHAPVRGRPVPFVADAQIRVPSRHLSQ